MNYPIIDVVCTNTFRRFSSNMRDDVMHLVSLNYVYINFEQKQVVSEDLLIYTHINNTYTLYLTIYGCNMNIFVHLHSHITKYSIVRIIHTAITKLIGGYY